MRRRSALIETCIAAALAGFLPPANAATSLALSTNVGERVTRLHDVESPVDFAAVSDGPAILESVRAVGDDVPRTAQLLGETESVESEEIRRAPIETSGQAAQADARQASQTRVRSLALAALRLVEQKLHSEYGLRAQIGIEQEMGGHLVGTDANAVEKRMLDSSLRFAPDLDRFYKLDPKWGDQEILEMTTLARPPERAAQAVEEFRNVARSRGLEPLGVRDVTFEPVWYSPAKKKNLPLSLHVNLSMLDQGGKNVFYARKGISSLGIRALRGMMQVMRYNMLPVSTHMRSFERFHGGLYGAPSSMSARIGKGLGESFRVQGIQGVWSNERIAETDEEARKLTRVENMLAGADADPYLAALLSVAGAYWGLKQDVKPRLYGLFKPEMVSFPGMVYAIPQDHSAAIELLLSAENPMRLLLNEISGSRLGDSLLDAFIRGEGPLPTPSQGSYNLAES